MCAEVKSGGRIRRDGKEGRKRDKKESGKKKRGERKEGRGRKILKHRKNNINGN